jgi:hypothetical protein
MKHKMILLALAAVSAVMFAVPAVAAAGEWEIDPASGKFPQSFTAANIGNTTLTQDPLNAEDKPATVTCTGSSGSGKYTTKTTGEIELTFTGCKESQFGSSCTSAGQATGTITTTNMTFHNIMIDSTAQRPATEKTKAGTAGILITSNAGHFATFNCALFFKIEVTGSGVIGDISAPECGGTSKTSTLKFESTAEGTQKYMQITTEGTKFDLTSTQGGTARTASQDGEGTVTYNENMTMTCP